MRSKLLFFQLIFFVQLHGLTGQSGRPNFDGSSSGDADRFVNYSDTIDRPDLRVVTFDIARLNRIGWNVDTSLHSASIVEPFYKTEFYNLNLGSENSAAQLVTFQLDDSPLSFGHNSYKHLFEKTASDFLYDVNRSYWNIHYGLGVRINSSNLSTSFYRSFSRGIGFNLDYNSFSDDGWPVNRSANKFRQLNLKIFQKNKKENRITYILYKGPSVEENLDYRSFKSSEEFINVKRGDKVIEVGNKLTKRDSSSVSNYKSLLSKLVYYKKNYNVSSNAIFSDTELILPVSINDSLSYHHEITGLKFENKINFYKERTSYLIDIQFETFLQNFKGDLTQRFYKGLLGFDYSYQLNSDLSTDLHLQLGMLDAYGHRVIDMDINYKKIANWNISVRLKSNKFTPSLAQSRLVINNQIFQNEKWSDIGQNGVVLKVENAKSKSAIGLEYEIFSNLIIPGRNGLYVQLPSKQNIAKFSLVQDIKVGPISSRHKVLVQSVPQEVLGLPTINYNGNVSVNFRLFRKKLYTEWGVDYTYIPSFDTPEYYPITGEFSNITMFDDRRDLLLINPYLSAKVSQFHFFIKGVNLPRILSSSQIANLPDNDADGLNLVSGFPVYNYRLRFGIKWTLLD